MLKSIMNFLDLVKIYRLSFNLIKNSFVPLSIYEDVNKLI